MPIYISYEYESDINEASHFFYWRHYTYSTLGLAVTSLWLDGMHSKSIFAGTVICHLVSPAAALNNGLSRTPALGWNSWVMSNT